MKMRNTTSKYYVFFLWLSMWRWKFWEMDILESKLTSTLTCHHDRYKNFSWRNDQFLIEFVMNIIAKVLIREQDSGR